MEIGEGVLKDMFRRPETLLVGGGCRMESMAVRLAHGEVKSFVQCLAVTPALSKTLCRADWQVLNAIR